MLRRTLLSLALAAVSGFAVAEETATLKFKFVYGGVAPLQEAINPNKDAAFCGKTELKDEKLIVNAENNGIKNVVLYVFTGRGGTKLPKFEPVKKTHILANQDCRFEPHVLVLQVGDTLKVTNPDEVGHNANLNFFENKAENFTIPPKGEKSVELKKAEPAPIPVECNIHPWMKAHLVVLDHPFAAVSDENGELTIEGLPVGEELIFRVSHEGAAGAIDKVKVNGKDEEWKRSRLTLKLKAGMNDLGQVTVPAAIFGK